MTHEATAGIRGRSAIGIKQVVAGVDAHTVDLAHEAVTQGRLVIASNQDLLEVALLQGLSISRANHGPTLTITGNIVGIEHLSGSYSGIMGLPVFETAALLRQVGFKC